MITHTFQHLYLRPKERATQWGEGKAAIPDSKKGVHFVYCPDLSCFCEVDYSKEWAKFSQKPKLKESVRNV